MKLTRLFSLMVLAVVTTFLAVNYATAADWPQFRRTESNPGKTANEGAHDDSTAWTFTINPGIGWPSGESLIWSSPVIGDTLVYVAARNGKVYCLGLSSGILQWSSQVADTLSSTPAVEGGLLYVLGGVADRRMHCIDAADGDSVWCSDSLLGDWSLPGRNEWVEGSPCVVDDDVFIGAPNGTLYCFEADSGYVRWKQGLGESVVSSPAYESGNDLLYVGASGTPFGTAEIESSAVVCVDPR